jgi:hypothetical protein
VSNITVRTKSFTGTTDSINCNAGEKVLSGGMTNNGSGNAFFVKESGPTPSTNGSTPTGWKVTFSASAAGTVSVVCGS